MNNFLERVYQLRKKMSQSYVDESLRSLIDAILQNIKSNAPETWETLDIDTIINEEANKLQINVPPNQIEPIKKQISLELSTTGTVPNGPSQQSMAIPQLSQQQSQLQLGQAVAVSKNKNKMADHHDVLHGGKGDELDPTDVDPKQLEMGKKIEMEHTTSPDLAEEISLDHLYEFKDYYTRLKDMEAEAEREKEEQKEGFENRLVKIAEEQEEIADKARDSLIAVMDEVITLDPEMFDEEKKKELLGLIESLLYTLEPKITKTESQEYEL